MVTRRRHLAEMALERHPLNAAAWDMFNGEPNDRYREKVAIIGASYFRNQAPLDDPSWEVWGLNAVPVVDSNGRLRCDRWFDLHQRHAQSALDLKWIREVPVPIYVPEDLAGEGPMALRFRVEALEDYFGVNYWTCTFAYQIALAVWERKREIGLYGVELLYGNERESTVELACVNYWIGQAEARGVRVTRPTESRLGRHVARYGLEYTEEKERVEDLMTVRALIDKARRREDESREGDAALRRVMPWACESRVEGGEVEESVTEGVGG